MTQLVIPHIEDEDLKALKPLLDRMGISYKKQVIKEVDDPELLTLSNKFKNSPRATAKEQKEALDKIRGL